MHSLRMNGFESEQDCATHCRIILDIVESIIELKKSSSILLLNFNAEGKELDDLFREGNKFLLFGSSGRFVIHL